MPEVALHPALETIEPRRVAEIFDDLRKIPRRSYHEEGAREYVKEWARGRGFRCLEDIRKNPDYNPEKDPKEHEFIGGNIAIDVPASPGCEGKPRIVLQAHTDMVCTTADGETYDFAGKGIEIEAEGDALHSAGFKTTLGADDAMGVALAMSLAEDETLLHPPLTLLFTAGEEVGLWGAQHLGEGMLPRDVAGLINLDAEEGPEAVAIGCASGRVIEAKWEGFLLEAPPAGYEPFRIELKGLAGGHSGVDIHRGRGNAITLLNQVLRELQSLIPDFRLTHFNGGEKFNAIPTMAECLIYLPPNTSHLLQEHLREAGLWLKRRYEMPDKKNEVSLSATSVEPADAAKATLTVAMRDRLLQVLAMPNGVIEQATPDFPTVSNNVGLLKVSTAGIDLTTFARAAIYKGDRERALADQIKGIIEQQGGRMTGDHYHSGWEEPKDSKLVQLAEQEILSARGKPQKIVYHAGVEVQAIVNRLRELGGYPETISSVALGPHVRDGHNPKETLYMSTVKPTRDLVAAMLAKLAA